jgi:photosystem II stability/assembly factor-like uncharacterized protein
LNDINNTQIQDMIYALVAADNTIFAARTSGVWRSQDDGQTWHNTFDATPDLRGIAATALAVQGNRVAAGVAGAVACSSDGGNTWQVTGLASPPPLVVDILFSAYDENLVLAGTADDGVFVSSDGGSTWTAWNFGLVDFKVNCLVTSFDDSIIAGTESGLFRSHNGGKSWRDLPFPMAAAPVLSIGFTASHIFAGTQANGLLYADHEGGDWSAVPELAVLQSEAAHAILTKSDDLLILTDHHLIQLRADGLTHQVLHRFPDRQALALTRTEQQIIIGFVDGTIETL